jgi:hypothetical protein
MDLSWRDLQRHAVGGGERAVALTTFSGDHRRRRTARPSSREACAGVSIDNGRGSPPWRPTRIGVESLRRAPHAIAHFAVMGESPPVVEAAAGV